MTTTTKTLTVEDIEWTITPLAEDMTPEDCISTGDDAQDELICDRIREDALTNEWAWCCIEIKGQWNGIEATTYLGGASYESRKDFIAQDYYYQDLQREVLAEIQAKAERIA